MSDLISKAEALKYIPSEEPISRMVIAQLPTIEPEPTLEQIEEYCRMRCLVVVDGALFNEMKSRWSAEPIKHGHWEHYKTETLNDDIMGGEYRFKFFRCSECHFDVGGNSGFRFCPNCGADMREVEND